MPVLLIHGVLDQVVPVTDAHELAAEASTAHLLIVPGVGHADIEGMAAVTDTDTVREFVARAAHPRPAEAYSPPPPI